MTVEEAEAAAFALPAVTKVVQWGGSDVYKVGGKAFAVCGLGGGLSFKVSEIGFMALTEGGPARQARYMAKGHWVSVDLEDLTPADLASWLESSHGLIAAKLTRKARAELDLG